MLLEDNFQAFADTNTLYVLLFRFRTQMFSKDFPCDF